MPKGLDAALANVKRKSLAPQPSAGIDPIKQVDLSSFTWRPKIPTITTVNEPYAANTYGDFQLVGMAWIAQNKVGILGDDMGLGKTYQTICAVRAVADLEQKNQHVLLVVKASCVGMWAKEIARFDPDARVYQYPHWNFIPAESPHAVYMVVSYEKLMRDENDWYTLPWDWIILDEAHKIKGNQLNGKQSQIASIIHMFNAPRKLAITGTPIANAPEDVWNILRWLGLDDRTWKQFADDTLVIRSIKKRGRRLDRIAGHKEAGLARIREVLNRHMLRRLEKDVLGLPAVRFVDEEVTLTLELQRKYDCLASIQDPDVRSLRQRETTSGVRAELVTANGPKIDRAIELIKDLTERDQKVIVFSQWMPVINALHSHAIRNGIDYVVFTGASKERDALVHRFQTEPSCKLFIGSTKACREGITLTAASTIIFIDLEWSPKYVEQAIGRAQRIGQKNSVTVYRLTARQRDGSETIDHQILRSLASKDRKTSHIGV